MRDFSRAEAVVRRMKGLNELNDAAISRFAETKKFDEVAASLAVLNNSAPTNLMVLVHTHIVRLFLKERPHLKLWPCVTDLPFGPKMASRMSALEGNSGP
jgi:hypothetical protein